MTYYSYLGPDLPAVVAGFHVCNANWVMISNEDKFRCGIEDFDFAYPIDKTGRRNVLIHKPIFLEWADIPEVSALLVQPGLPNASVFSSFDLKHQPHVKSSEPVLIRCLSNQIRLFDAENDIIAIESAYVEHIKPLILVADEETVIYNHVSRKVHEVTVLELCSGGFGGWTVATEMLKAWFNINLKRVIGIDMDHGAMQNWCASHRAHYIETQMVPWEVFQILEGNVGIVADINSHHWRQGIMKLDPECWCISAPCISWSGAGSESGFNSIDGLVLLEALGMARMARPRILLLEQVRNFENHSHYSTFVRLITWAGFRLIYQKVHDASDHSPMIRPRWIGLAVDMYSKHDYNMGDYHPNWLGPQNLTPASFGCNWQLSDDMKKLVQIAPNVLQKYFNPKLAPSIMKGCLSKKRSTNWSQVMPVLMAHYGSQHTLHEKALESKGLYGHFLEEPSSMNPACSFLRWWHPLELCLMFFPHDIISIPKDLRKAWKYLGNAIASNHAIFALATMLPLLLQEHSIPNPKVVLQTLITKRMSVQNSQWYNLSGHWIVHKPNATEGELQPFRFFFDIINKEVGSLPYGFFFQWGIGRSSILDIANLGRQSYMILKQIDISPTIVEGWSSLMIAKGNNMNQGAFIRSNIVVDHMLQFWAGHASVGNVTSKDSHVHPQFLEIGKTHNQSLTYENCIVISYVEGEVWIFEIDPTSTVQEISTHFGLPLIRCDALGSISPHRKIQDSMITFQTLPTPIVPETHPIRLGNACCNSKWKLKFHPSDDSATFTIYHEEHTLQWESLKYLWHSDHNEWWHTVGRHVEISQEHDTIRIYITAVGTMLPLPMPDTLIVFMTLGLKTVLQSFASLQAQPVILTKLKWIATTFWEGTLPDLLGIPFFRTVVGFFMKPWNEYQEINFVGYGKRLEDQISLKDLTEKKPQNTQSEGVVLIAMPSFSGGGLGNINKKDWDLNVRNQLAGALLPHGVNVASLPQMTETILRFHGRPKVQQIMKSVSDDQQNEMLVQLAHQAGFHIQSNKPKPSKPANPGKKAKHDDFKNELRNMDIEGVTIEPGYLVSEGNVPVPQLSALIPKSTGIFLTKEAQVDTWLADGKHISPDPLAVFLIGCTEPNTSLKHEAICLPARDASSRPILLSGVLVQLGQVVVEFAPKKDAKDMQEETSMVSITTWKEETDDEHWQEVIKHPSKTFIKMMEQHSDDGTTY